VVLVSEFGESSILLTVRFWVESSKGWLNIRSNLAYRIKKAFDEAGVNIPFPIRTLKLDEDDRAFLKTMDSMKKGIVPEIKPVPSEENIKIIAEKTSDVEKIPHKLFNETPKDLGTTPIQNIPVMSPIEPASTIESIATSINATPRPIPQEQRPEVPVTPPPTHL